MSTILGNYHLPYAYPLNFTVRYTKCGMISGLGNYAMSEVFQSGKLVHKGYYPYKEVFNDTFKRANEFASFLSDCSLDIISKEELDYIYQSDEYEFAASRFLLSDSEFRESLKEGTIIRHVSPYNQQTRRDFSGLFLADSSQEFYEDDVNFDNDNHTIQLTYHLVGDHTRNQKSIVVNPCFLRCFFFTVKFNLLLDIAIRKEYWRLSSGCFAANRHTISPFFNYYDKEYIQKLNYVHIL